jgi:hypothetical protein
VEGLDEAVHSLAGDFDAVQGGGEAAAEETFAA